MSDSSDPPQAIAERGRSGTSVEVVPATERSMVRRLRMGKGVLCFLASFFLCILSCLPFSIIFSCSGAYYATRLEARHGGILAKGIGKNISLRCRRVRIWAARERLEGGGVRKASPRGSECRR